MNFVLHAKIYVDRFDMIATHATTRVGATFRDVIKKFLLEGLFWVPDLYLMFFVHLLLFTF